MALQLPCMAPLASTDPHQRPSHDLQNSSADPFRCSKTRHPPGSSLSPYASLPSSKRTKQLLDTDSSGLGMQTNKSLQSPFSLTSPRISVVIQPAWNPCKRLPCCKKDRNSPTSNRARKTALQRTPCKDLVRCPSLVRRTRGIRGCEDFLRNSHPAAATCSRRISRRTGATHGSSQSGEIQTTQPVVTTLAPHGSSSFEPSPKQASKGPDRGSSPIPPIGRLRWMNGC